MSIEIDGLGDAGPAAHHLDHVAPVQLPAAAQIDLSVDAHVTGGDQHLALAAGVHQVGDLEELSEPDHVSVDHYVAHADHCRPRPENNR